MKSTPSNIALAVAATLLIYLLSPPWVIKVIAPTPLIDSPTCQKIFSTFYKPAMILYEICPPYKKAIDLQLDYLKVR